jgi:hypothetical protein
MEIALLKHTPEGTACAARPREIAYVSTAEIRRIEIAAWLVHQIFGMETLAFSGHRTPNLRIPVIYGVEDVKLFR